MRPLIGVATAQRITPAWPFIAMGVRLAGGVPRRLPPRAPAKALEGLAGVIVGGGDDIGTELYGGKVVLDTKVDPDRDAAERRLLERVWDSEMPILGICRGAQMLNVVRGGTLHQNIYEVYLDAPKLWTPLPLKHVTIEGGTRLAEVAGREELVVNSLHNQSVDRLGEGIRVSARDRSGVVQGIEVAEAAFRVGVQWHPEFLLYRRPHRALFRALVRQARRFAKGRELPDGAGLAEAQPGT